MSLWAPFSCERTFAPPAPSTFRRIDRRTVFAGRKRRAVLVEIIRKPGASRIDWSDLIKKAAQGL